MERRKLLYIKLSDLFTTFRATLNPHLDVRALDALGVDVCFVDLTEESTRDEPYYFTMSQSRLQTLEERPDFNPGFLFDDDDWYCSDGCPLLRAFLQQMTESKNGSAFRAYEKTKWCPKWKKSSIERKLHETGIGSTPDPTRQYDWSLSGIYETKPLPHQTCISIHHLPNVQGPIRSEMMIITAVMLARMKRQRFQDQEIFPLLMLSVIGRHARIIQAHMCPNDQRLKVRYSQLSDFSHHTPAQSDLFLRWMLSDPITETKAMPHNEDIPTSPTDDTAPKVTVIEAIRSPRDSKQCDSLSMESSAITSPETAPSYLVSEQESRPAAAIPPGSGLQTMTSLGRSTCSWSQLTTSRTAACREGLPLKTFGTLPTSSMVPVT